MVNEGKGRLFRRSDGKYLIYLPLDLAEDSMFPFKGSGSISVKISFKLAGKKITHRKVGIASRMRAHVLRKCASLKNPIKEPQRRTLLTYFCDFICTQR